MRVLSAVGKKLVIDIFAKQTLALQMGATLQRIDAGIVQIKLPKHHLSVQHHNTFHGGIISYLADTAGGLAGISLFQDPHMNSTTIQMKINFLRPGKGQFLIGRGKVIHQSGSLIVSSAEIFSGEDLVALMVQTNKKLFPKKK